MSQNFTSHPVLALVMGMLITPSIAPGQTNDDLAVINKIETDWQEAWNKHDVKALSALTSVDVDFIVASGNWLQGRPELEEYFTRMHERTFKGSVWAISEVKIKFLKPDVAMVHVRWRMTGRRDIAARRQRTMSGITTRIELKKGGNWLIRESQDTYAASSQSK